MDATRAVVLVPGLARQAGTWHALERHLARQPATRVATVDDLVWSAPVHDLTEHLSRHVDVLRAVSDVRRVDFVGHNFGGILVRYFAQLLDTDGLTGTVITIGTPHRGTTTPIEVGALTAQLRPGSSLIEGLEQVPPPPAVDWINYVSPDSLLVNPSALGILHGNGFAAANVVVNGHGDLSLHLPRAVRDSVVHRLAGGDDAGDPLFASSRMAEVLASRARHPSSQPPSDVAEGVELPE